MSAAARPEPIARLYRPGDEEGIRRLFRETFGHEKSAATWEWRFVQGPVGPATIFVLEDGDRLVGQLAYVQYRVWVEGQELLAVSALDNMVAADQRGRGGYGKMIGLAKSDPPPASLELHFPNEASFGATKAHVPTFELGGLTPWVRWLHAKDRGSERQLASSFPRTPSTTSSSRPRRAIQAALAAAGQGALAAIGRARAWAGGRPRPAIVPLDELGDEVDELATQSRHWWPCSQIRDAAYLRWRWQQQPERDWRIRAVRSEDGRLRGLAVHGRLGDTGWVPDLMAPDAAVLRALLLDAVGRLRSEGCAVVLCPYQDSRPWVKGAFRSSGFLARGVGPRVTMIPRGRRTPEVARQFDAWFLTVGDTDHL